MIADKTSQMVVELRKLVLDLGKDGGIISPSIYDTAQCLRLYPPVEGVEAGLDWLLEQQQPDGGWSDPAVPIARDVPTLSAILALHKYRWDHSTAVQIRAGLDFLASNAAQWENVHIDALPIAAEVIFPYLLEEAEAAGLTISRAPYARLMQFGQMKLDYLRQIQVCGGTAPAHSWEAYGCKASADLLDSSGGVGHSPAATAAWLQAAAGNSDLAAEREQAMEYLADAHRATGVDIPGVMPVVFPISIFEQSYGLYPLLLTGLMEHPALREEAQVVVNRLHAVSTNPNAYGMSQHFVQDVDITSVSIAVLERAGYPQDASLLQQFWNDGHYFTYRNELNPSVFSNAHALYALSSRGERAEKLETFLAQQQQPDGSWRSDKYHVWSRYTTLEVIIALVGLGHDTLIQRAGKVLCRYQHSDGSWRQDQSSSPLATAYSVLGLYILDQHKQLDQMGKHAFNRGLAWLSANPNAYDANERVWLGKEIYAVHRIDLAYWLSIQLMARFAMQESELTSVPGVQYA